MNRKFAVIFRLLLILPFFLLIFACAAGTLTEPPPEVVSFSNGAEPLLQARLGEIRIEPITVKTIKYDDPERTYNVYKRIGHISYAENELENRLQALLGSTGLFMPSSKHVVNVTAIPYSLKDISSGFPTITEYTIIYEFRTREGTLVMKEKITSRGNSSIFEGNRRRKESIGQAISTNVAKLSHVIKEKLPNTWQAYVERREERLRQIETNLKKESRYFRVISANATLRNMPDASATEVGSLSQSDLVHITGSLPSGWFQVSREGKPVGWVHSTLLREDFAGSPSYMPEAQSKVGSPSATLAAVPVDVTATGFDFGAYHALVVGNNDYQHLPKLHTAVNDAEAMAGVLQNSYGFNVRIIRNGTRAEILRAINDYRLSLSARENLLIYYAGHGWLDREADEGYWLPVDATDQDPTNWISNSSITSALRAMHAKHILIIADSCYSGKLARGINIKIRTKDYYQRIVNKKGRTVMASGGLEPVDDEGGKGKHSVFASVLIETLNENQGVLDATLLFSRIRRPVMVNTDQTPEYSDIHKAGHDGGDFLFVRKK